MGCFILHFFLNSVKLKNNFSRIYLKGNESSGKNYSPSQHTIDSLLTAHNAKII